MRTGHFSPEKQTVEIRIRGHGEGAENRFCSCIVHICAFRRAKLFELFRFRVRRAFVTRQVGGVTAPLAATASSYRILETRVYGASALSLPPRCGLYWQNKISRACPICSKIFQESVKEDEGQRKRDEDSVLRLALMLADCNSLSVIH